MATTAAEFIDYFVANTSAAVDREDIRKKINIAQNQLLGMDTDIMRVLPDPYFATTNDTYLYDVAASLRNAATGEPLTGIDVRCIKTPYSRRWNVGNWSMALAAATGLITPLRWVDDDLGGYVEAPVTCPESRGPGSADIVAYWDDQYNPGTTVDRWRVRVYKWPDQILSESDFLTIPDDFVYDLLFERVSALVERPAYGSAPVPQAAVSEAQKRFNTKYSAQTIYFRPRNSPAINA